jgi:hypothetical protein
MTNPVKKMIETAEIGALKERLVDADKVIHKTMQFAALFGIATILGKNPGGMDAFNKAMTEFQTLAKMLTVHCDKYPKQAK